jgi:hypothetical protein
MWKRARNGDLVHALARLTAPGAQIPRTQMLNGVQRWGRPTRTDWSQDTLKVAEAGLEPARGLLPRGF